MKTSKMLKVLCLLGVFSAYGCTDDSVAVKTECGNGILEYLEACDDGNAEGGDGCSETCTTIEDGYECRVTGLPCTKIDPGPGPGPEPINLCGNGKLDDKEICDDANTANGDGCTSECQVEFGYKCSTPGEPCVKDEEEILETCGNGLVDDPEQCDDGNRDDNDGCSHNCLEVEDGYLCPPEGGTCTLMGGCGDGHLDPGEECDFDVEFGNPQNGDGCSTDCTIEPGYTCDELMCTPYTCGNGVIEGDEECEYYSEDMIADYGLDSAGQRLCNAECKFAGYCGDSILQSDHEEECDLGTDGNTADEYGAKDGCRSDCKRNKFCGDGVFSLGYEQCDPSVSEDAKSYCNDDCTPKTGFICNAQTGTCKEQQTIKCGDGSIDGSEECDQSGKGCTACKHDEGYKCIGSVTAPCSECSEAEGNQCKLIADSYGDGKIDPDGFEECDDNNRNDGDGCSSTGKIEDGYYCLTPGKLCATICGDGKLKGKEECDDGNRNGGDGCSASCTLELGYYCPTPGTSCSKDTCNNGFVGPNEICDGGEGCDSRCQLKSGYCYSKSKGVHKCLGKTCGNYILEYGEQCDDGNTLGGDGCSDTCTVEYGYECPTGIDCRPICGDGKVMWQLGEKCDLGTNNGPGKGCSVTCTVEDGFSCTDPSKNFPDTVNLDVTYRDFVGRNLSSGSGLVDNAIYSELSSDSDCTRTVSSSEPSSFISQINGRISDLKAGQAWLKKNYGYPDFEGFAGNLCFGLVKNELDSDGKPVFNGNLSDNCCGSMTDSQCKAFVQGGSYNGASYPTYVGGTGNTVWHHVSKLNKRHHLLCKKSFAKWYRTDNVVSKEYKTVLPLTKVASPSKYVYDSANTSDQYFSPIDGQGWKEKNPLAKNGHNGSFTTEISTMFQYKGGETLNFSGDDDVWVFINGKLFLDIGGMHATVEGQNTLSSATKNSQDLKNGGTISRKYDDRYGIYEGGLYELKVFHTERAASGANFKLTLDGFINPSSVSCSSTCGDGILASTEQCDYNDKTAASALGCVNCVWNESTCGNGRVEPGEACDTGYLCNDSKYKAACDKFGLSFNADTRCNETTCQYKDSLCGNGTVDAGEECDSNDKLCNSKSCKWYCGDGIIQAALGEECDEGRKANESGLTCSTKCKAPSCGDGVVSPYAGEICDDGNNVEVDYNKEGPKCMKGCSRFTGYCGDGKINGDEQCDLGKEKNTGAYGGCNPDCTRAAYCGDGHLDAGEACDPKDPATMSGCTDNCVIEIN